MRVRILGLLCLAAWGFLLARVDRPAALAQSVSKPVWQIPGRLVLEWPETIRQNDPEEIVLAVQTETAGGPAEEVPALFQTYNVVAAAHLELPGVEADLGTAREALQPGRTVTFRWKIRAKQPGTYPGTVWLHLDLVPKQGGEVEEVLVMARKIEIRAVTVFGMPADVARWVGLAGLGVSFGLGYPFLFRWVRQIKDRRG